MFSSKVRTQLTIKSDENYGDVISIANKRKEVHIISWKNKLFKSFLSFYNPDIGNSVLPV
jgi:hypothetical protein